MNFDYIFYDASQIKLGHSLNYEYTSKSTLESHLIKMLHGYYFIRSWSGGKHKTIITLDTIVGNGFVEGVFS